MKEQLDRTAEVAIPALPTVESGGTRASRWAALREVPLLTVIAVPAGFALGLAGMLGAVAPGLAAAGAVVLAAGLLSVARVMFPAREDDADHEPGPESPWAKLWRWTRYAVGKLDAAVWLGLLVAFEWWWQRRMIGDLSKWGIAALAALWGGSAVLDHLRDEDPDLFARLDKPVLARRSARIAVFMGGIACAALGLLLMDESQRPVSFVLFLGGLFIAGIAVLASRDHEQLARRSGPQSDELDRREPGSTSAVSRPAPEGTSFLET